MNSVSQTVQSGPFKLAVITAAISAGFAGEAQAGWISTAPVGFTPQTVSTTGGTFSFDVDGDAVNDFTLSGGGGDIDITGLGGNEISTFAGFMRSYDSPNDFQSSIKS